MTIIQSIPYSSLLPYVLLTVGGVAVLLMAAARSSAPRRAPAYAAMVCLALSAAATALVWGKEETLLHGALIADTFASFATLLLILGCALALMLSGRLLSEYPRVEPEYCALLLFATLGMSLMAASGDLVTVFVALETFSIALYILAGFARERRESNEASLKYFLLGAFATGFLLYGIALLYGATGTTNLTRIGEDLSGLTGGKEALVYVGVGMLLIGFGFKVGAVPFHQWMPDVYEGAPTAVTAFMAFGAKAAGFAAVIRVMLGGMGGDPKAWAGGIAALAALTMIVGNVVALSQHKLKRMLAYSSIAHAGYLLVGVVAASEAATPALLFYLAAYLFMTIGAFAVVLLFGHESGEDLTYDQCRGLAVRHPGWAATMTWFLLSLTGIPPTAGFFGKLYVFGVAVQEGHTVLAVIGVLTSVLSVFYYLRIVVMMYMHEAEEGPPQPRCTFPGRLAVAVCVLGVALLGFAPGLTASLIEGAKALPK